MKDCKVQSPKHTTDRVGHKTLQHNFISSIHHTVHDTTYITVLVHVVFGLLMVCVDNIVGMPACLTLVIV